MPFSMPTIAYISNLFPSPVEPYVVDEIRELRRRGVTVLPSSARKVVNGLDRKLQHLAAETLYLQPAFSDTLFSGEGNR
jgi:hypothetical protein